MTIHFFKKLYKPFSLLLFFFTFPLQASSPTQELSACKEALLAQLNQQNRLPTRGCPISEKLVLWLGILRNPNQFTSKELITFLKAHSHWPQHETLCRKAEETLLKNASFQDRLAWFNQYPPQTPEGMIAYAKALLSYNERTKAGKIVVEAWHTMDLTKAEENKFLRHFGHILREKDHITRLHFLLGEGDIDAVHRLVVHVPVQVRKIAEARIAFLRGDGNALQKAKGLPAQLRQDEGLLYETTKWHRNRDNVQEATQILIKTPSTSQHAQKWWKERNYIARELIALKDYQKAYEVLKNHHLEPGTESFADAEWLMGWIRLRFLHQPNEALEHFKTFSTHVQGAISKARGAYWQGRAYEAQKKLSLAQKAYKRAASYKTTYYGQLAAAKIHAAPYPSLSASPRATHEERKKFRQKDLVSAAHILKGLGSGATHELRKFLLHIAGQAESKGERELAVELAHSLTSDYVVWTAKKAGYSEPVLLRKAYPALSIPQRGQGAVERALVMAVVYQESRFMPNEKSTAGAMGLMQLMPQTALREAKRLGIRHKESQLYDPKHNTLLGSAHLHHLLKKFQGSYILTCAAYNAGHTPVERWLVDFGDPRQGDVDVVDWVELIPYAETRNYVQRVLENITAYRSLEGKPKKTLIDDLKR